MGRILLIDIDKTKFPNLALMKLSAWHKAQGDEVERNFLLGEWDKVCLSCVFTRNLPKVARLPFDEMEKGGAAIDVATTLPSEIEHIMPDYGLYPKVNYSVGFTSRGCIRKCPWCIVPAKEGAIQAWAEIYEFWDRHHKNIVLLDNNLLAAPNWKATLNDLAKERVGVDFNQGLDIRLVDEEKAHYLSRVRLFKDLRFSFDELGYEPFIRRGLGYLKEAGVPLGRIMFFVLVGFDSEPEEDLERFRIIAEYGASAFPMFYEPVNGVPPRKPFKIGGLSESKFQMPRGPTGDRGKFLAAAVGSRTWASSMQKYLRLALKGAE